jgi:hypothetical protein
LIWSSRCLIIRPCCSNLRACFTIFNSNLGRLLEIKIMNNRFSKVSLQSSASSANPIVQSVDDYLRLAPVHSQSHHPLLFNQMCLKSFWVQYDYTFSFSVWMIIISFYLSLLFLSMSVWFLVVLEFAFSCDRYWITVSSFYLFCSFRISSNLRHDLRLSAVQHFAFLFKGRCPIDISQCIENVAWTARDLHSTQKMQNSAMVFLFLKTQTHSFYHHNFLVIWFITSDIV